jgi:hypothetical protein
MPLTYDSIATGTFSGGNYITFSSIPSTYTDLRVVITGVAASGLTNLWVQFNGVTTGTSYNLTTIRGNGSTVSGQSTEQFGDNSIRPYNMELTGGKWGFATFDIFSYTGSHSKVVLVTGGSTDSSSPGSNITVGSWSNTAAISTIRCVNAVGGDGTATLYGIKAA